MQKNIRNGIIIMGESFVEFLIKLSGGISERLQKIISNCRKLCNKNQNFLFLSFVRVQRVVDIVEAGWRLS